VLSHGPLYEAWCLKRDLPFVIISPQLPIFGMGEVDYIKNRTRAQIPRRRADGVDPRPDERNVRREAPMGGTERDDKLPDRPEGPIDGWNLIADELIAMVDRTVRELRGDPKRVYLTGLIKIPALSRERKARLTEKPLGVLGSVLVGITFAAGWTPCIGPILASILLYASTAQTVGTGILLLSVYSLGLGVPFLIASLGMNTFLAASKGIRKQLHTIEVVSGVILIVFGLALVTNVFSYFVAFLSRFLPAVG